MTGVLPNAKDVLTTLWLGVSSAKAEMFWRAVLADWVASIQEVMRETEFVWLAILLVKHATDQARTTVFSAKNFII